jgi:parallel beta-helix repeat protein/predicted outer membrane repeat protein
MGHSGRILLLSLSLCIVLPPSSGAIVRVVPDEYGRISDALLASDSGDTVLIRPGIYSPSMNGEAFPLTLPDGVSMIGAGRDSSIIDAEGTGQVLSCTGLSSSARLETLTFRGGFSESYSGGIQIVNSSHVTMKSCRVTGNYSWGNGGGMRINTSSDVRIENCVVDLNVSESRGGGIYCQGSSPDIVDCTFSLNRAYNGGGVSLLNGSSPSIASTTFESNSATNQGGGIESHNDSSPLVSECIFSQNTSVKGGAFSIQAGAAPIVTNSQFLQNSATSGGGAIFGTETGEAVFSGNLMDGNLAGRTGGALYLFSFAPVLIDSNTFSNNTASDSAGVEGFGGAIACFDGPAPSITNNTIEHNTSVVEGAGIHMHLDCSGTIENNIIMYNFVGRPDVPDWGSGGGIFLNQADPLVQNNIVTHNTSMGRAGGIYIQNKCPPDLPENRYPLVTRNLVADNVAGIDGGGIATSSCDSSNVTENTISNNVALHGGGAIHLHCSAKTYISENRIEGNRCEGAGGGAIFITENSKPTIIRNTISGNTALNNNGGAINVHTETAANIFENLFCDNTATNGGTINVRNKGRAFIERNTFAGNVSESSGGAVYANGTAAILVIINNTFHENASGNGGAIEIGESTYALIENNVLSNESRGEPLIIGNPSRVFVRHNCFWNTSGDTVGAAYEDSLRNFFADPNFIDPGLLDFELTEKSPCIDAGNPESPLDPDSTVADVGRFYFDQGPVVIDPPGTFVGKIPTSYLIQNYPNPFNPSTTITLAAGKDLQGTVDLSIYDVRGRLVRHLYRGELMEGLYRFVWDGSDERLAAVGSGVYFCRVKWKTGESTVKMIMEK